MTSDISEWYRSLRPTPPRPGREARQDTSPVAKPTAAEAVAEGFRKQETPTPGPSGGGPDWRALADANADAANEAMRQLTAVRLELDAVRRIQRGL